MRTINPAILLLLYCCTACSPCQASDAPPPLRRILTAATRVLVRGCACPSPADPAVRPRAPTHPTHAPPCLCPPPPQVVGHAVVQLAAHALHGRPRCAPHAAGCPTPSHHEHCPLRPRHLHSLHCLAQHVHLVAAYMHANANANKSEAPPTPPPPPRFPAESVPQAPAASHVAAYATGGAWDPTPLTPPWRGNFPFFVRARTRRRAHHARRLPRPRHLLGRQQRHGRPGHCHGLLQVCVARRARRLGGHVGGCGFMPRGLRAAGRGRSSRSSSST